MGERVSGLGSRIMSEGVYTGILMNDIYMYNENKKL